MIFIIKLFGMIITFVPSIYFAIYIINKATEEQKFDLHLNRIKDKLGFKGVLIAYINRISLWCLITSIGIYLSSFFENNTFLEIGIVALIIYIISYFIDNRNEF